MNDPLLSTAVRELPPEDRPRERLAKLGPEALRDGELLAILFRTGMPGMGAVAFADHVLKHFGDLRRLARASVEELQQVKGVGIAKAVEIKAALELGARLAEHSDLDRPKIRNAEDVARLLMLRFKELETEQFKSILLNTKNQVLKVVDVSDGGLDSTPVVPRDVFRQAVRENASAVIVCHNHPSGDPEPSPEDKAVTQRLAEAAAVLGVRFLDHIVFGDDRFVSMNERNLM